MSTPVIELPVLWQTVTIDVESVAPMRQFNPQESYDVANMSAVICTQVDQERIYRLLLTCDVEAGTKATVRVMSSDDVFDRIANFKKITKASATDYVPFLDKSGFVAVDAPQNQKIAYIRTHFKEASITLPAGQQKLRIHASQKVLPVAGDPKAYALTVFAPLLGFTLAGGQTNLSVVATFPPAFEGTPITFDAPLVEAIPGQPMPGDAVAPFSGIIGAVQAYAWHWRNDPKVTITYRYS